MKATVKIELRKDYANKNGSRSVCLRYTAHRRSTLIGLNISVLPKHWNQSSHTVRAGNPFCLFYNKTINEMYQKAMNIVFENFYKPLSLTDFVDKFKDKQFGNTDFYVFAESEVELLKKSRAAGTISNYYKLLNKMKEWRPKLSFDEITLDFIQEFHNHEIECGNVLSTIYKKHANFKFLVGLAVDKEKIAKNPYEKFEIKKNIRPQNNDILTENELAILQVAYDKNQYEKGKQEVLREILFSCYTSLSFAEYSVVTYSDLKPIKLDNKNKVYQLLCNERTKTGVKYKIPIVSENVRKLLGKGEPFQKIFNPLSNQPANRYIKDILVELKISKNITFHRARHTFRTIAARKGIRDGIAERIMGHAEGNDIKDIYTHLHDEDIVREMLEKWGE